MALAPTPRLNYADFLAACAGAMHAAGKTVSVATQAVSSACMSSPCRLQPDPGAAPDCAHPWNLAPCPWIRSFFQHDAIARTGVDAVVPMDTYTINATEAPIRAIDPIVTFEKPVLNMIGNLV
jgi:hypothetical protein